MGGTVGADRRNRPRVWQLRRIKRGAVGGGANPVVVAVAVTACRPRPPLVHLRASKSGPSERRKAVVLSKAAKTDDDDDDDDDTGGSVMQDSNRKTATCCGDGIGPGWAGQNQSSPSLRQSIKVFPTCDGVLATPHTNENCVDNSSS